MSRRKSRGIRAIKGSLPISRELARASQHQTLLLIEHGRLVGVGVPVGGRISSSPAVRLAWAIRTALRRPPEAPCYRIDPATGQRIAVINPVTREELPVIPKMAINGDGEG